MEQHPVDPADALTPGEQVGAYRGEPEMEEVRGELERLGMSTEAQESVSASP